MTPLLQAVVFCLAFACMGSVSAQAVIPDTGNKAAVPPRMDAVQQQLYRGSKIIGSNVRDAQERKIGQIRDLVLDGRRGEIAYAIVSFGGVMDADGKYHAIPWQALQPSDDGRYYVLHADREIINLAPGFDKAKWPDMTDRKWSADVDRYWSRMVGRGNVGNNPVTGAGSAGSSGTSGGSGGTGTR